MEKELKLILKKIIAYMYLFAGYLTIYCFYACAIFEKVTIMDVFELFSNIISPMLGAFGIYITINHTLIVKLIKINIIRLFEFFLLISLIMMPVCLGIYYWIHK